MRKKKNTLRKDKKKLDKNCQCGHARFNHKHAYDGIKENRQILSIVLDDEWYLECLIEKCSCESYIDNNKKLERYNDEKIKTKEFS